MLLIFNFNEKIVKPLCNGRYWQIGWGGGGKRGHGTCPHPKKVLTLLCVFFFMHVYVVPPGKQLLLFFWGGGGACQLKNDGPPEENILDPPLVACIIEKFITKSCLISKTNKKPEYPPVYFQILMKMKVFQKMKVPRYANCNYHIL